MSEPRCRANCATCKGTGEVTCCWPWPLPCHAYEKPSFHHHECKRKTKAKRKSSWDSLTPEKKAERLAKLAKAREMRRKR